MVARQGTMITARNERHVVTRKISMFKPVNVKMEPPMESDLMEDHSMNNDIPIEVSGAEDSATRSTVERSKYPSSPLEAGTDNFCFHNKDSIRWCVDNDNRLSNLKTFILNYATVKD